MRAQIINPKMDFGCASYCQHADQCLGTLPPELIAQKEDLLKDRVAIEMKTLLQKGFQDGSAMPTRVASYAEEIGQERKGRPGGGLVRGLSP